MKTNNLTFGAKIRELRLKQGLTQSQVAEAVHVSTQAYSRWENDERQPSYEVLAELLFFLGNPEFKIKDKEIKIGDDMMKPVRKYLEIPTYEEVLEMYDCIFSHTKNLTTIEAIQSFAEEHLEFEVEINGEPIDLFNPNEDVDFIRYGYKNLLVYVHLTEDGGLSYYPWMTLYDDNGTQFDDCRYLSETEYWSEIKRIALLPWTNLTLNPDYPTC